MTEAEFIKNIAHRLGRQPLTKPPSRTLSGPPEFWIEQHGATGDTVARFSEELEGLGGHVQSIATIEEMQVSLTGLLSELGTTRIGVWGGSFTSEYRLTNLLQAYETLDWGTYGVQDFQYADVCISGCAYAIANTGTIVMMSDATHGRSVAVLPAVHMVILRKSQIKHTMGDVMKILHERTNQLPSSVHFISGPSRSSDIENDQTIGIHGPAAIYVFIVE